MVEMVSELHLSMSLRPLNAIPVYSSVNCGVKYNTYTIDLVTKQVLEEL